MALARTSILRSRHAAWLAVTAMLAAVAIAAYVVHNKSYPNRGGTMLGYVFGLSALGFLLSSVMLVVRKRMKWAPLGRTEFWLDAHIWLGVLSLLLALLHCAFMASGLLSWLLLLSYIGTVATGLLGAFIQKAVPPMLTGAVDYETLSQAIPEKIERMGERALHIIEGRPDMVRGALEKQVMPLFVRSRMGAKHLLRRFQRKAYLGMLFNHMNSIMPVSEKATIESLRDLALEKEDLEFQAAAVRVLEVWLYAHVPMSTALLAFVVLHILQVMYYGNPL